MLPTDKPRITITMTEEEFERIEAYRFETRQKNQTQAILSLVRLGLEDYNIENPPDPEEPGEDVKEFISMVSQLTDEHKRFLFVVLQALIELEQGQLGGSPGKADRTT